MSYSLKVAMLVAVLSLGCSQAGAAAEVSPGRLQLAALDSPDGPPPCGQDNVCNLAACRNDPDCPKDLPGNAGQAPDPARPLRASDIKDCTSREVTEIGLAIDWGAANWSAYEAVLEGIRDWPVTIGNCLENRFKKNGNVVCEGSATGLCRTANGWASYLNQRCHLCSGFLERVAKLPDPVANRQACYFALVTHEWGHTCDRGHKTLEIIDDEAFNFWKSKHPDVTISYSACGLD